MEVSFLVVFLAAFLAFFDSVKVCADREEVPTANSKRWIPVEGSQRQRYLCRWLQTTL